MRRSSHAGTLQTAQRMTQISFTSSSPVDMVHDHSDRTSGSLVKPDRRIDIAAQAEDISDEEHGRILDQYRKWSTLQLGLDRLDEVWNIRATITKHTHRGYDFKLYVFKKKQSVPWIWWQFKEESAPEFTITNALELHPKYKTLVDSEALSGEHQNQLLKTLEFKYGGLWSLWRKLRPSGFKQPPRCRARNSKRKGAFSDSFSNARSLETGWSEVLSQHQQTHSALSETDFATCHQDSGKDNGGEDDSTKDAPSPQTVLDHAKIRRRRAPWISVQLGPHSNQDVWYIWASAVNDKVRGSFFRMFLYNSTKSKHNSENAWIKWYYSRQFQPQKEINMAVKLHVKYEALVEEEGMSPTTQILLLDTLQSKYGEVWTAWRQSRADELKRKV